MGAVITFYSYKGGVGPVSMAPQPNIGVLLAKWGKKNIINRLGDLEASRPGKTIFKNLIAGLFFCSAKRRFNGYTL